MNDRTNADVLLAHALLAILQDRASVRGEIELDGASLEQGRHFENCPECVISNVACENGSCGNGTCNLGRIWMTVSCPHQLPTRGFYCQYGSLRGVLAEMEKVARDLADGFDAHAAESVAIANEV